MTMTVQTYVEPTACGGYRLTGSRVTLTTIVHEYWAGKTPESIVQSFPSLTPEQVYGAIAFYLRNRDDVDRHSETLETEWEKLRTESHTANRELLDRLRTHRLHADGESQAE